MRRQSTIVISYLKNHLILAVVLILAVAAGSYAMLATHAATAALSLEPERGTLNRPAGIISDATASNNQAIVFHSSSQQLALCGNSGTPPRIQHVIVIMMENLSYNRVVGSANAPFQTSLANRCGVGTAMFGATHTSAANYFAISAGEFPAASPPGCGSIAHCADSSNNLYNELTTAGLGWKGYLENMPTSCDQTSVASGYKIGHNPIVFYTDIPNATCRTNDVGVPDLTAKSGPLWNDLQNQTLTSFSWISPNIYDGVTTTEQGNDSRLQSLFNNILSSNSYQAGNTLVFITYDEGRGGDTVTGEDCTNQSLDMPVSSNGVSAHQDSCHIPFFVIYPYTIAGTHDGTFFDHYSITKTVDDLFGLPYIAHARDAQTNSLVGHFNIAR